MSATFCPLRALALVTGVAVALAVVPVSAQNAYLQHNLVSDIPILADQTDPNLVNPWGIASSPTGPFWVSDNHSGLVTLYNSTGAVQSLVVTIPSPPGSSLPAAPSGIVFNNTQGFLLASNTPAQFIFATDTGTIFAWNSGTNAVLKLDHSAVGAAYTGLALAQSGGSNFLYAANFHDARIEVFDAAFADVTAAFVFSDPAIPAGFAPFNIQRLNGALYVAYAMQDASRRNPVAGAGNGYVDLFDTGGHLTKRLVSNGPLNAPWGLALAPAGFGPFGGDLLVGNFGDGRINVFDPATSVWRGPLREPTGSEVAVAGLWGLTFGNGGEGGYTNALYFTAGIAAGGSLESHGLLGRVVPLTGIYVTNATVNGNSLIVGWVGGTPPYLVGTKGNLSDPEWFDAMTTSSRTAIVAGGGDAGFVRLSDQAPATVVPYTASLSGAAELPAVTTTGSGLGTLTLKGNTLAYRVTYSGLTGPPTKADLRGPATSTNFAGVIASLVPLGSEPDGILTGSMDLTTWSAAQVRALKGGMTYVTIHTAVNPAGEIRGQVAPVHFSAYLTGMSEVPPVNTPGWGTASFMLIGNQLNCALTWNGLQGAAVTAHIHGPASPTNTAVVLVGLPSVSGTSGNRSAAVTLTPDNLGALIDIVNAGMAYVNVHTVAVLTGEIRGQVGP